MPEHRHQDQFRGVIQETLDLAKRSAPEIEAAYRRVVVDSKTNEATTLANVLNIVVRELEAFILAHQVHEEEQKAGTAKPGAVKRLRAEAKTILGSVKDTFRLNDPENGVIVVLIEALYLVEGD